MTCAPIGRATTSQQRVGDRLVSLSSYRAQTPATLRALMPPPCRARRASKKPRGGPAAYAGISRLVELRSAEEIAKPAIGRASSQPPASRGHATWLRHTTSIGLSRRYYSGDLSMLSFRALPPCCRPAATPAELSLIARPHCAVMLPKLPRSMRARSAMKVGKCSAHIFAFDFAPRRTAGRRWFAPRSALSRDAGFGSTSPPHIMPSDTRSGRSRPEPLRMLPHERPDFRRAALRRRQADLIFGFDAWAGRT